MLPDVTYRPPSKRLSSMIIYGATSITHNVGLEYQQRCWSKAALGVTP